MRPTPIIEGLFCPHCGAEKIKDNKDTSVSGRMRYICFECKGRTTNPLTEPKQMLPKFKKERSKKRFILTSALNDTPVNTPFLRTLETMSRELDAQLVVVATVYKNPDLARQGIIAQMQWPTEILPYACQEQFTINDNLVVRGDARIQATVINPLTGANHCAGTRSEIFGHAQVAFEPIPTPKNSVPKGLWTTGTISMPAYGGSAQAQKAAFHHSFCALLVEVVGKRFWVRQLHWDGNGIQDLDAYYTTKGVKKAARIPAVVFGDLHVDVMTKKERNQVLSIMTGLSPEKCVIHDTLDMHTGSHHKRGDVLVNLRQPNHDVRGELTRTLAFIEEIPTEAVVVQSNHDCHLDKWFNLTKPQLEQVNLDLYYELGDLARQQRGTLFELYAKKYLRKRDVTFTDPNEEYDVCGVDLSQHGDRGPNGARGSARGFSKTGRKTVIGHSHSPRIDKGTYQVGVSSMSHAYAAGYSSWMVCHVIVYQSGKRTQLFSIDGALSPMTDACIKA